MQFWYLCCAEFRALVQLNIWHDKSIIRLNARRSGKRSEVKQIEGDSEKQQTFVKLLGLS